MVNKRSKQKKENVFPKGENLVKSKQPHGDVWQDKARIFRARTASPQPASQQAEQRALLLDTNDSRSQKHSVPKQKAVQVTLWVNPIVKTDLQRIAKREGMSVSAAGGAFLEQALQQRVDLQYGALLKPVIEQTIAHEMRSISTRLAWLLVRVAYDSGQTRSIVTNILGRQSGVTPDILKTILDMSGQTAKANITRRTPQIVELIEAVEQWLIAPDEEEQQEARN